MKKAGQKRAKIGFFGHFGTPNSGNEGTLVAILSRLRDLYPNHDFVCICTYPQVVEGRYGIDALPISTRSGPIWNRQARLGERLRIAFVGLGEEALQYVRAFKALRGTDMLIIPGTGLLTDAYGLGGWGPYSLFKWSLAAKVRGCKVLFVSVGAGPLRSVRGRCFAKLALWCADYRSYRDSSSMMYLQSIGVRTRRDRIYPDLVFSLPQDAIPAQGDRVGGRQVVGLGLMEYAGTYSAANPTDDTYVGYLESLVVFVEWLLNRDYEISLLLGDWDAYVIQEFRALLRGRLGAYDEGRITDPPEGSFEELLASLRDIDVVVATRFHNVLYSILLGKPVFAIAFHHKCTSLMSDMGLSEYCHDIHDMDADVLIERFQHLMRNAEHVRRTIGERVSERQAALDEQYNLLFDASKGASRPVEPVTGVT